MKSILFSLPFVLISIVSQASTYQCNSADGEDAYIHIKGSSTHLSVVLREKQFNCVRMVVHRAEGVSMKRSDIDPSTGRKIPQGCDMVMGWVCCTQ